MDIKNTAMVCIQIMKGVGYVSPSELPHNTPSSHQGARSIIN